MLNCCCGQRTRRNEDAAHKELFQPINGDESDEEEYPKPVGTFQYLPNDYERPKFELTKNQEANTILIDSKSIFLDHVVSPRKEIDTKLRSFRTKAGKSPDAALTACFELWKSKAFPVGSVQPRTAFHVTSNRASLVIAIESNAEQQQYQDVEIAEEMNDLLSVCHKLLGNKARIVENLERNVTRYEEIAKHYRSMKVDAAKKELMSLISEVERLVQQVDSLLTDIKAAVSSSQKTYHSIKSRIWLN